MVVGGSGVMEEGDEEGEDEVDAATGQPIPKKKRSQMGRRKLRGKLSDKPQDFQVEVCSFSQSLLLIKKYLGCFEFMTFGLHFIFLIFLF